jgi:hypothetical protein
VSVEKQQSHLAQLLSGVLTLAASLQTTFASMGIGPLAFLPWIRDQVSSPAYREIAVGSTQFDRQPQAGILGRLSCRTGRQVPRLSSGSRHPMGSSDVKQPTQTLERIVLVPWVKVGLKSPGRDEFVGELGIAQS